MKLFLKRMATGTLVVSLIIGFIALFAWAITYSVANALLWPWAVIGIAMVLFIAYNIGVGIHG